MGCDYCCLQRPLLTSLVLRSENICIKFMTSREATTSTQGCIVGCDHCCLQRLFFRSSVLWSEAIHGSLKKWAG